MGIGFHSAKFLCMLKAEGLVNYDEVLMLGRQNFNLCKRHIQKIYQNITMAFKNDLLLLHTKKAIKKSQTIVGKCGIICRTLH